MITALILLPLFYNPDEKGERKAIEDEKLEKTAEEVSMNKDKGKTKLESPVTLFAAIETRQHEVLRTLAFDERRSIADIVREALDEYIGRHRVGEKTYARSHSVRRTR